MTQTPEDAISQSFVLFLILSPEFWKNQENVPQPESYVVSLGSEIAGEKSSSSEYVCISPSGKFILAKEDGKGNTQVASEQR